MPSKGGRAASAESVRADPDPSSCTSTAPAIGFDPDRSAVCSGSVDVDWVGFVDLERFVVDVIRLDDAGDVWPFVDAVVTGDAVSALDESIAGCFPVVAPTAIGSPGVDGGEPVVLASLVVRSVDRFLDHIHRLPSILISSLGERRGSTIDTGPPFVGLVLAAELFERRRVSTVERRRPAVGRRRVQLWNLQLGKRRCGIPEVEPGSGHRDREFHLHGHVECRTVDGPSQLECALRTAESALAVDHHRKLVVAPRDTAVGPEFPESRREVTQSVGRYRQGLADHGDASSPTSGADRVRVREFRVVVDEECCGHEVLRDPVRVVLAQRLQLGARLDVEITGLDALGDVRVIVTRTDGPSTERIAVDEGVPRPLTEASACRPGAVAEARTFATPGAPVLAARPVVTIAVRSTVARTLPAAGSARTAAIGTSTTAGPGRSAVIAPFTPIVAVRSAVVTARPAVVAEAPALVAPGTSVVAGACAVVAVRTAAAVCRTRGPATISPRRTPTDAAMIGPRTALSAPAVVAPSLAVRTGAVRPEVPPVAARTLPLGRTLQAPRTITVGTAGSSRSTLDTAAVAVSRSPSVRTAAPIVATLELPGSPHVPAALSAPASSGTTIAVGAHDVTPLTVLPPVAGIPPRCGAPVVTRSTAPTVSP